MTQRRCPFFTAFFCLFATTISILIYFYSIKRNYQPLHRLQQLEAPAFADDMDRASLIECTRHHLSFLKKQSSEKQFCIGTETYSNSWLLNSLELFLEKLEQNPSPEDLKRFLLDNYLIFQAGGRDDKGPRQMLVTGYYEPIFKGSRTRQPPFLTPIYSPPPSLITIPVADKEPLIGRYGPDNQLVAYWSRKEIETSSELLKGNELAFLEDPFDAFLLQVQGSGKIHFPNDSIRSIHFAASNGHKYASIGKLLVEEKAMTLEAVTIPAIRAYLQQHPDQQQRILHSNPRYIFFNWGDDSGPVGSSGEVLTPGRSIAIDGTSLPEGAIGYLVSRTPIACDNGQIAGWKPLTRFVFPQDSGAAIKGTGRVDIFFGNGINGEFAANHMKEEGKLYFLIKKPPITPKL